MLNAEQAAQKNEKGGWIRIQALNAEQAAQKLTITSGAAV